MSALAVQVERTFRFYTAPIGKKAVMAVSGVVLFGYVLGHMIGNLQIFLGRDAINNYAQFLHSMPRVLWLVRAVLLAMLFLHVLASVQLWLQKRRARPQGYYKKDDVPSAYAARTMLWSGPIIFAFVIFHVLHLTTGSVGLPFRELDAYDNVVLGFRHPAVAGFYIVAMILLSMHLYHGLWSMFHSVGWDNERFRPMIQKTAAVAAIAIAIGFISIPVAVLLGYGQEVLNNATRF